MDHILFMPSSVGGYLSAHVLSHLDNHPEPACSLGEDFSPKGMRNHWYFFLRDFFLFIGRGSEQIKARSQWSQELETNHPVAPECCSQHSAHRLPS